MGVAVGDGVDVRVGVAVTVAVGLGVALGIGVRVGEAVAVGKGVGLDVAQALGSVDPPAGVTRSVADPMGNDEYLERDDDCGGAPIASSAPSPSATPPSTKTKSNGLPMWRRSIFMRHAFRLAVGNLPLIPSCDIILSRLLLSRDE